MTLGIEAYKTQFPDADVVLLEPRRDDHESFFSNIFSFSSRLGVCERAYTATRASLLRRREEIEPILQRHGVKVDWACLAERERSLWFAVGISTPELGGRDKRNKEEKGKAQDPGNEVLSDLRSTLERVQAMVEGAS
jgi:hypothetical protein